MALVMRFKATPIYNVCGRSIGFRVVQIFAALRKALLNSALQRPVDSSLSANFSLKLGLDLDPKNVRVRSAASFLTPGANAS